jgi:hypothetical protein
MGETLDIPDEGERAQEMAEKAANRTVTESPASQKDDKLPDSGGAQQ